MLRHISAVGDVEHELAGRAQDFADRGQDFLVILLVGEVAERIAHDGNAVEAAFRQPRIARVTFLEDDVQAFVLGAFARQPDEITRAVDTRNALEAAACQFQAVAALSAAQVENGAVRLNGRCRHDEVDLAPRVLAVFDDVAVRLYVKSIEEFAPPFLWQVSFQIRNRTQG